MSASAEVPYLFAMLRRRLRVLVLGLLLGVLFALLVGAGADRYQAQAQLLIGAPATGSSDANSLERNLNSQLSVLRSRETAAAVSELLGERVTTAEVVESTTISAVPGADVVLIQTVTGSPAQAQAIADAYVEVYLATSAERAQARIAPELERLNTRLAELDTAVAETNQQLAAAVAPFLRRTGPSAPVPDPRTVAPEAAARQQLLLNEYDRLLAQRQTLQQEQQLRTLSSVLQEAVADEEPVGPDRRQQVAIVLGAALASVAVALAIDALSGRAVSEQEVEAALGAPIAARLPSERRLRSSPLRVQDRDRVAREEERLLWLRVERLLPSVGPALVVVTGASSASGATTVALVLAQQLRLSGRSAVLVDTVGGPGSLTDELDRRDEGGIPALVQRPPSVDSAVSQPAGDVPVLTYGPSTDPLSREDLDRAVEILHAHSEVVVVDTDPALGGAFRLAQRADAVVLAVNVDRAKAKRLEELGLVMSDFRDRLLPVLTHPSRSGRGASRRSAPGGPGVVRGGAHPVAEARGTVTG